MKRHRLPDEVMVALKAAVRAPGWNTRSRDVRRFQLGECVLLVVPFRRWAYRCQEQQTAAYLAWRAQHECEVQDA